MHEFFGQLRLTLRQLRRRPGINALAILSLALGIGVNSSIFSLVNAVLLRDPAVRDPASLVEIYTADSGGFPYATSCYPDFLDLQAGADSLSGMSAFSLMLATYDDGAATRVLFGEAVSANFFDLMGLRPALGRGFAESESGDDGSQTVAVLGYGFWQKEMGGSRDVLGKTLRLNGRPLTIVGVAPKDYRGTLPSLVADYWVPIGMYDALSEERRLQHRGSRFLFVKGRLAPGVELKQAQAQMDGLFAGLAEQYPGTNAERKITLVPSREVVFNPGVDKPLFGVAALLLTTVAFVLLIACSNIANLLLARALERQSEVAVRLALGASRGQLVRQLLLEGLLLAALGGALGLALAFGLSRWLVSFQPPLPIPLALDLGLDHRVLLFTLLLTVVTGLLSGLVPALRASRPDLVSALHNAGGGSSGGGRRRFALRNALVVLQVAVSTVLLLGAGLFLRSLGQAQAIDPGFELRQGAVAMVSLGLGGRYSEAEGRVFLDRMQESVRSLPGVRSAALAGHLPLGFAMQSRGVYVEGAATGPEDDGSREVDFNRVGPGYFETMGIALTAGRAFTAADREGAPLVTIVNEEAARRFWPGEDPIGRRIHFGSEEELRTVVGVAATGKYRTLGESPRPFVYEPLLQDYFSAVSIVVASDRPEGEIAAALRRELQALDPGLPIIDLRTLSQHLAFMLFPARMGASLLASFGLLGLILASVGLYGVVAHGVSRRTREVGVRRALGAQSRDVVRLVVRQGMTLVVVGLVLGGIVAALGGRLLRGWLYGISSLDPITFAVVPALLLLVALAANWIPARRATRIEPTRALRYE
jgi:predicted permease